jgi:glutamyl-Q tRNA(Asp) synthetase
MTVTGRFAPSPTGPLHLGSLVAAVGSWLFARRESGRWLVRIEDLDRPRVVAGSADEILRSLARYGLESDEPPVWQSERGNRYEAALGELRARGAVFNCACSRSDVQRAASAPAAGDPVDSEPVYPGTCRNGIGDGRAPRSIRFRVPDEGIVFDDAIAGRVAVNLRQSGDFVVRRADGIFAYQLAVVVDDAEQQVTQVVRGSDLLLSTPRQIALQHAFGYSKPTYAHLPLLIDSDGAKLSKRNGALPVALLDDRRVRETLSLALRVLGCGIESDQPRVMLEEALRTFDPSRIERGPVVV